PESLTVILSVLLYGFLGILLTIILLVLASRYKVFRRIPKYYNWAVKLYIPLVVLGTMYFSLQIGLIRGFYKVLDHESAAMTEGIYHQTIDRMFASQSEKEAYFKDLKALLVEYSHSSEALAEQLKARILSSNVDIGLVDKAKNGVATWLIDTFKDEIFSAVVFGALSVAGEKMGVNESLSWSESQKIMDILLESDAADLEVVIREKLTEMLGKLFYKQYASMRSSSILLWFLIVPLLPLLEFFIYKRWLERKLIARQTAKAMSCRSDSATAN
ncbi:MAG TPA: hypothetical protein VHS96_06765, partial [Bacteroidia bacterium]|nr:hypothetical protein [Bacteroidia bacterium]